jgi:hypothetical protein
MFLPSPIPLFYDSILPNICSLNPYFHRHNINIPDAEIRGYNNITKYIVFSSPVSTEVMNETKQNKKLNHTPHDL